jgi:hypothetical protein
MASKKKKIILLVSLSILLLVSGGWLKRRSIRSGCLGKDEIALYNIKNKNILADDVEVYIKEKKTNLQKSNFLIDDIFSSATPIEVHQCGVYVMKMFNYDYHTTKQKPGFRIELWKYSYDNQGKQVALLAKNAQISGTYYNYYSYDFRVDPTESYIALDRSYAGSPTHAFVIKNLKTLKDDFILPVKDILDKYLSAAGGSSDLNSWTKDGRYFWGNLFDGANVLAFIRIETKTWRWDVFPAPAGAMGGDALNPERGLVTYHLGAPWTADADFDQMYREQWKKEGKKVPFYVYNLITKEKTLLAEIDDPTWYFKPKWISDTELEYYLPGDKRGVYEVK